MAAAVWAAASWIYLLALPGVLLFWRWRTHPGPQGETPHSQGETPHPQGKKPWAAKRRLLILAVLALLPMPAILAMAASGALYFFFLPGILFLLEWSWGPWLGLGIAAVALAGVVTPAARRMPFWLRAASVAITLYLVGGLAAQTLFAPE